MTDAGVKVAVALEEIANRGSLADCVECNRLHLQPSRTHRLDLRPNDLRSHGGYIATKAKLSFHQLAPSRSETIAGPRRSRRGPFRAAALASFRGHPGIPRSYNAHLDLS